MIIILHYNVLLFLIYKILKFKFKLEIKILEKIS